MTRKIISEDDVVNIITNYKKGDSLNTVGKMIHVRSDVIRDILVNNGISIRGSGEQTNKYNYITTRLEDMLVNFNPSSEVYDFLGFNSSNELADSVLKRKRELFADKKITYKKSDGSEVILTIADIENRLFDLSFDPNHPPELRWGAPKNSGERQNMKLFSTPLRTGESLEALNAYELEKGLRYYPMRQNTSTSLNPEVNPKEPPFKLFDEVIGKYV